MVACTHFNDLVTNLKIEGGVTIHSIARILGHMMCSDCHMIIT